MYGQEQELADSNARRSQAGWLEQQIEGASHYSLALQYVAQKVAILQQEGLADPCMMRYAELDAYQVGVTLWGLWGLPEASPEAWVPAWQPHGP